MCQHSVASAVGQQVMTFNVNVTSLNSTVTDDPNFGCTPFQLYKMQVSVSMHGICGCIVDINIHPLRSAMLCILPYGTKSRSCCEAALRTISCPAREGFAAHNCCSTVFNAVYIAQVTPEDSLNMQRSAVQGMHQVPCAARDCEVVEPRITATACRSPFGLSCGASLRRVTISCFSLTLGSAINAARDWPDACLDLSFPPPSALNANATSAPSAADASGLSIDVTAVSSSTASSTVTGGQFTVAVPVEGSAVAETIENCPILDSGGVPVEGSSVSQFSGFLDSPQGLPSCDVSSAAYVYSPWQACADEDTGQPISCSDPRNLPWNDNSRDSLVRCHETHLTLPRAM